MSLFKKAIDAVEENNRMNNGKWSDWDDAYHIMNTYEIDGESDYYSKPERVAIDFIDCIIKTNGENIAIFQSAIDCLEYGYSFKR